MKDFWNSRYADREYAYGTAPNLYFKQELDKLTPGRILLPADGEGRNGVYAATRGWEVTSFDFSNEAMKKALALAADHGVTINYQIDDLDIARYAPGAFDALGWIFVHPPQPKKSDLIARMTQSLRLGGHVIMEVFSKSHQQFQQSNPTAGGPREPDRFFSKEDIQSHFKEFEVIHLEEKVVHMEEGEFHSGESSVIQFTGIKRQ